MAALVAVPCHADRPSGSDGHGDYALERVIDSGTLRKAKSKIARWITGSDGSQPELLVRPYGVAWLGEDLVVADPGAGHVLKIGRRGKVVARSGGEIVAPIGVAACRSGVVVTESGPGTVWLLDDDLRILKTVDEGLQRPTGVACNDGKIYVVETGRHRVLVFDLDDLDGVPVVVGSRGSGEGKFNFPAAIALDRNSIWVGDTLNFRVQQISEETGAAIRSFGTIGDVAGEMPRIKGLSVDVAGHLWITDAHLDQVSLYSTDGEFLSYFGQYGLLPGEFSFPAGVAAHKDGRVAVVDSFNRRIQVFRAAPVRRATGDP